MKKTLLKTMYHLGAFTPFHWMSRDKVLILTYHRFSCARNPHRISREEFTAHLAYLKKYNRVLPLTEAVEYLENGKSLPPAATVITIDDGYRDAYETAFPVLKEFGLPATVYAVTGFLDKKCWLWTDLMRFVMLKTKSGAVKIEFENDKIEGELTDDQKRFEIASRINSRLKKMPDDEKKKKINEIAEKLEVEMPATPAEEFAPMTWDEAREMDACGVQIESHTVTHPILTNISADDLNSELVNSKKRLEDVLDRKVKNFCYPNGSLSENVRRAVENAGYTSATTTDYGFNARNENPFLLKRIDASATIENFAQSASGFEALRR
jgi:peptidoglycan/xylan/chitin deacetylase (PgdA/CDA1 family)